MKVRLMYCHQKVEKNDELINHFINYLIIKLLFNVF